MRTLHANRRGSWEGGGARRGEGAGGRARQLVPGGDGRGETFRGPQQPEQVHDVWWWWLRRCLGLVCMCRDGPGSELNDEAAQRQLTVDIAAREVRGVAL